MLWFFRRLFGTRVTPMNKVYIYADHIISNYKLLKSLQPQADIFPVVKANAYGHWLAQVTQILDRTDAKYLVVDSYPEYIVVTQNTDKKVLILGETLPENYKKFNRKKAVFCVYNMKVLETLASREEPVTVHLFLNTGMYREGIDEHQIAPVIKFCLAHPQIQVEWVLSHFHSADVMGMDSMNDQITKFKSMYYQILDAGLTPTYRYIANSAGTLKMKDDFFNACRPWLALYGYNPLSSSDECYDKGRKLKPALSIASRLLAVHEVAAGQGVSYEYQWYAMSPTTVGIVPFGYAEWLPRNASNKVSFRRKGKKIDQIGRITMNLSCVDLGDRSVKYGDEIEIISNDPKAANSIYALSAASDTIVYENLVRIDKSLRREII